MSISIDNKKAYINFIHDDVIKQKIKLKYN